MRYLLSIILCLWASCSWAFPPGFIGAVTQGAGGTADYCDGKLGSYSLYYDADHPNGTTTACITGGTTTVSATTGIDTASTAMNTTPGGTYGVSWDGALNHYLTVSSSSLTDSSGRVVLDFVWPATMPTTSFQIWEWGSTSAGARMYLNYNATGASGSPGYRMTVYHYDGTTTSATTAYIASSTLAGTVTTLIADWSASAGYVYAKLGSGTAATTALTVTEFSEPADSYFGENALGNVPSLEVGFDAIKMGASQQ